MKRQICIIITMIACLCSIDFASAQSATKTTSYKSYIGSRTKPVKISDWIKDSSKVTTYRNPKQVLEQGDIFMEQYLASQRRELDVLRHLIRNYRDMLVYTQQTLKPGGSTAECSSLTSLDITSLMTKNTSFKGMMAMYPVVVMEEFKQADLDGACRRWVACVGGSTMAAYQSLTATQSKRQLCEAPLANQFLSFYNTELPLYNFDVISQYNNIFMDGTGANSPFDLGEDIRVIKQHQFEDIVKLIDSTSTGLLKTVASAQVTQLPDELIVSTQQLIQALELETAIDPRQDDEIAALIGQVTTVSGSSVLLPTGNVLNVCMDPSIVNQQAQDILEQLRRTQQQVSQYNQSLNTNQSLNNAIDGTLDPASLVSQSAKISAITTPTIASNQALESPSMSDNPLGAMIADINEADLISAGSPTGATSAGMQPNTSLEGPIGSTQKTDSLKQCASACVQDFGRKSSCVEKCEATGAEGTLSKRLCETQCNNAKIACVGQCLCSSTSEQAQQNAGTGEDVSKLHKAFELRRCLVPTNKVTNPQAKSCVRRDPETGVMLFGSMECYLDQTIAQGEYTRESGKGGTRTKPREGYQLSVKFDLTKMIRFPITVINNPIRSDKDKKKEVLESQNKQEYAEVIQQDPVMINTKITSDPYEVIERFVNNQIKMRELIGTTAQAVEQIVTKKS